MLKYAKVINEETKACEVGLGTNSKFYQSIGMTETEVEQSFDGNWYVLGFAPEKPVEELQAEVRAVRNSYLEKYVDPKQLVMVWDNLSADDKKLYADYRQYLLDYTEVEGWYLQNPKTLDEWKQSVEETTPVDSENNELGEENIIEEIGEDKESEDLTSE